MKFRLFSVDFFLSFPAVAFMSCVLIFDKSGRIFACFFAATLHEIGHLLCMLFLGYKPQSVKLSVFDVAIVSNGEKPFSHSLLITLFGVIFNFFFGIIFLPFNRDLSYAQFAIGLFNLLPVKSLDGGEALSLLLQRKLSYSMTEKILFTLTLIFSVTLVFFGTLFLFVSKYNYSLLLIGLYLFAVLFIKQGEI